ncbi:MAG TPA: DNA-protecting protein DprA, partial [Planctomycetia bacterium]|nr:DNA-protecting protein DprA [Planctomycetia bacterium]
LEQLGPGPDRPRAAGVPQASPNGVTVAGPAGPPPGMSEMESRIWTELGADGIDFDSLAERTGAGAGELAGTLLKMELRRVVQRQPGNRYARK